MAITAAEILTIRRRTNATTTELSDAVITAIYDSTTLGNSNVGYTTYWAITELIGLAVAAIDVVDATLNAATKYSQKFDHLYKLLALWGGLTGLTVLLDSAGIAEGGIAAPCGVLIDCDDSLDCLDCA